MSAAACGFDTALLDVKAQVAGLPLAKLLDPRAAAAVPVNATVGAVDISAACRAAGQAAQAGILCVKLKVGVMGTREAELARIAAVRATLGADIRLRIDANAAWDVPEAIAIIRAAEVDLQFARDEGEGLEFGSRTGTRRTSVSSNGQMHPETLIDAIRFRIVERL